MFIAITSILMAFVLGMLELLLSNPKKDEPQWPKWLKLIFAVIMLVFGLYGVFEGYFSRQAGKKLFLKEDYIAAKEELHKAEDSFFKNREVLDRLAVCYKKIAESENNQDIARRYYERSVNYSEISVLEYKKSPVAKNNLINVYKRIEEWDKLNKIIKTFVNELEAGQFTQDDGSPITNRLKSILYTTIANACIAPKNPEFSVSEAIKYYHKSLDLHQDNPYVLLNLPPRYLDMVDSVDTGREKRQFLRKAERLNRRALELDGNENRGFALTTKLQLLLSPHNKIRRTPDSQLKSTIQEIENLIEEGVYFDYESWMVLAETYLELADKKNATKYYHLALSNEDKFGDNQSSRLERISSALGLVN